MFDPAKCDRCGDCLIRCQYTSYSQDKAIQEITALIEGKDADILRKCLTCAACNEYCAKGANPWDLILHRQEEQGTVVVEEATIPWMDKLMAKMQGIPNEVIPGNPDKPAISPCSTMEHLIPQGALEGQMFSDLTLVRGGDYICWIGYQHIGRESPVINNTRKFVDAWARLGAKEVVFVHDDCYTQAVAKSRELGIKLPFRPVHIIEHMLSYLKAHRRHITRLNKKIAYQRPCASRYTPEKEPLLDELFQLIGVERVARRYDRENALCCGGIFVRAKPELVAELHEKNLSDAREHGAEALVCLCPLCLSTLSQAAEKHSIAPVFLPDLGRMALGEKPFPS